MNRTDTAVLAHDRIAGCMRIVPGWQVDWLDCYGQEVEALEYDVEGERVSVYDRVRGQIIWKVVPGLAAVVKPDVVREKARPPA